MACWRRGCGYASEWDGRMRRMGGILVLLSLLDPGALERMRLRAARSLRRLTIVFAGIYVAYLALALFFLWRAWETTRWSNFWTLAFLSILVIEVSLIGVFRLPRRAANAPITTARADAPSVLRRAAASGDERLAPPTATQQPALAPTEAPAEATVIGPLRRLDRGLDAFQRLFVWVMPVLVIAMVFGVIFNPLLEDPSFPQLPLSSLPDIPDTLFFLPGPVAVALLILGYARFFNP